ncbi:MAG: TonB-dependent receptor [Bacteroidales bacterium]|nr:TonB-dependent receptor [Bacteroidales bacterium]
MNPFGLTYTKIAGAGLLLLCAAPIPTLAAGATPFASEIVQQTGKIKGTIVDEAGEPIIGATVVVKGTTNGTVTDFDGNFEVDAKVGDLLDISYVGYKSQQVKATAQPMNIVLKEDTETLEEVVVVGYSSTSKRDLIASVSTVKADQISNMPVTNIAQGLAGRSPGLIVQASGGGVNSTPSVSIRGGGEPLYVIDGVIRSKDDFANLSPDDIQSMSILKDASATAVYGSRATNGILQVVTKKGKEGKVNIEYDFNQSFSQPSIWDKKLDSWDRAYWSNVAFENDGKTLPFTDDAIKAMKDGSNPEFFNNTNWRELVLKDWAPQQKHTVRLTGGTDVSSFYISLGHVDQNSLYKSDNHWMKRTNFRVQNTTNLKNLGITINTAIDGYYQKQTHPNTSSANGYYQVFSHINDLSPLKPGVNKYGLPYDLADNPVSETAADAGYNRNTNNVINGKGEIILDLAKYGVKGLKLRGSSNYRYASQDTKAWRKDAGEYAWDSQVATYNAKSQLSYSTYHAYAFTNQAFAEYANQFGKHSVSALFGFEQYYESYKSYSLSRRDFPFNIDQISIGDVETSANSGEEGESGRAAWIGQAKYNYDNKYYVEASFRRDGSDKFAPDKRWGTFFSGSLGWVVTAEKFMQPLVEKNILNSLKLRASYGETGQDSGISSFAYLTSYNYNATAYVVNGSYVPGFTEGALPSPDLTWYTTKQFDLGFDFASLNSRLYGSFDYFYYSTKGYLQTPTGVTYLNTALGLGMPKVKSDSEHRRAGIEIQLGWRDNIGDFKYDVAANFTYFDQLWALDRSEAETSYMNPYQRTQQQKGYYGLLYHNLGYYTSTDDVYNSVGIVNSLQSGNLLPGDIKYQDMNGDGKIDDQDKRRLGKSSAPRGQFGININMSYKGFYLSTLIQGSTRFDMYLAGELGMQSGQQGNLMLAYDHQIDHWRPDNTNSQYPRLMSATGDNNNNNYASSDFWLLDGSYIRMKDFQFGYDFKYKLLKHVPWLTRCKVGISGQNLFTISDATKYGLDPENSSTNNYGYPVERTLAFTLNLGF